MTSRLDDEPGRHPELQEEPRLLPVPALEEVEGAERRHHEGRRHHRRDHVVRVLRDRPGAQDELAEAFQPQGAVGPQPEARRVLHECVGRRDEVSGEPASGEEGQGRGEVSPPPQPLLSEDQQREKGRLQEEGEESLHRQRVANDVPGVAREARPVGPELELHRDSGDDAEGEIEAEDPDPEPGGVVPALSPATQAEGLHHDDEKGQAHGQDGEQVVVDDRECELEAVPEESLAHHGRRSSPAVGALETLIDRGTRA